MAQRDRLCHGTTNYKKSWPLYAIPSGIDRQFGILLSNRPLDTDKADLIRRRYWAWSMKMAEAWTELALLEGRIASREHRNRISALVDKMGIAHR